ncbi:uncharacterized protein LOC118187276 [Stegodyphus dumicola]|uniref:uncharacterized protein LOC118187276 n=1 Tax=Stegodyphus dumicola TaxID=202533 RepID=UPI0015AF748B|nr:uncharacterized protein LOC118187276 [Stegodyphus dumicola]
MGLTSPVHLKKIANIAFFMARCLFTIVDVGLSSKIHTYIVCVGTSKKRAISLHRDFHDRRALCKTSRAIGFNTQYRPDMYQQQTLSTCSKDLPSEPIHTLERQRTDHRTFPKISGILQIRAAASIPFATRSLSDATGAS